MYLYQFKRACPNLTYMQIFPMRAKATPIAPKVPETYYDWEKEEMKKPT